MKIEYTGRQFEVTPQLREHVEHALGKLQRILGAAFETHVVLAAEKKRNIAEITVTFRNHPLVGVAEASDMTVAVSEALEKIDRQAVKYKTRTRARKRKARAAVAGSKWNGGHGLEDVKLAIGTSETTAVDVVVHAFPVSVRVREAHLVKNDESVALRNMTIEEAVKEAEFRDREVFVFRDMEGRVKVLHRKKDGKMELIEAPQ
jgi:putative sigma-54 modulation protein